MEVIGVVLMCQTSLEGRLEPSVTLSSALFSVK